MSPEEYKQWKEEAAICLSFKYSPKEIEIILSWFDTIRGSEEKDMIGDQKFDGMTEFLSYDRHWSMYTANMARLWVYAPYILERHMK